MKWDTAIALAYAAEQLFIAAQALTSDLVTTEQGICTANGRVGALLDNEEFLPRPIQQRLRRLHETYVKSRGSRMNKESAGPLVAQTMSVLGDVRDVLAGIELQPRRRAA